MNIIRPTIVNISLVLPSTFQENFILISFLDFKLINPISFSLFGNIKTSTNYKSLVLLLKLDFFRNSILCDQRDKKSIVFY